MQKARQLLLMIGSIILCVNGVLWFTSSMRHDWPVTFSIGVVTFLEPPESVAEMIREADNAMYAVKRASKDAIEFRTLPHIDNIAE